MQVVDGDDAGDVCETGQLPDPRTDLGAALHAEREGDEGGGIADDEGVVEQRLGDGGHALRGLGEGEERVVAGEPVGPLVGCITQFPGAGGPQGEARRQRRRRHQPGGDGQQQFIWELLERREGGVRAQRGPL